MKKTLSHLPDDLAETVRETADILRTECEPEMIILFGSYARGDYVVRDIYTDPDDNRTYEYRSDFDFLVITRNETRATASHLPRRCESRIHESGISFPVSIISHSIKFVNRALRRGDYFFTDIKKEGILLYDSGKQTLDEPRELSEEERSTIARDDYEQWFENAGEYLSSCHDAIERSSRVSLKLAAFFLHQATESLYSAILLVFTQYKPKTHYLPDLQKMTSRFDPRLTAVFPTETEEEKYRYDLLVRAYVDARYKKNYSISKVELEYLGERVGKLRDLVEEICRERIGGGVQ